MIALIRHAAAEGAEGRYIGDTDLPLSATGRAQARDMAEAFCAACNSAPPSCGRPDSLPARTLAALYVSPLTRARHTAAPLAEALGIVPEILDDLREIHLGQWEGLDRDHVRATRSEEFAARGRDFAGFRPPGGESFADLALRAGKALRRMACGPLPCAAVTHAGIIRVLLCRAQGLPLNEIFHFHPRHTGWTLLEFASPCRSGSLDPHLAAQNLSAADAATLLRGSSRP
ncbi:histidine phosphatase family protein [Paucidesulfovibrio longus]|uniref:histidine phosphatase family protein n=1 Tax=Paucidesulfovibrio longus TaxID=889 RepID=UPI0003B68C3B|nr:histidine phosphatase family protein [Paucidesulfovibrio longus]